MNKFLEGKVAVFTGASRNLGKAVAVELVKRGAKVVIGDILDAQGEATVKELNELQLFYTDFSIICGKKRFFERVKVNSIYMIVPFFC